MPNKVHALKKSFFLLQSDSHNSSFHVFFQTCTVQAGGGKSKKKVSTHSLNHPSFLLIRILFFLLVPSPHHPYPTTNGGMQNGSSVGIYTHFIHVFFTFGADLYVQSVLINKIPASELSRSLLSVRCWLGTRNQMMAKKKKRTLPPPSQICKGPSKILSPPSQQSSSEKRRPGVSHIIVKLLLPCTPLVVYSKLKEDLLDDAV